MLYFKSSLQHVEVSHEKLKYHDYRLGGGPAGLFRDLGLYEITENPADRWKYRTPTLRNIALTAPYMHDGSISTLREVIRFYNNGGIENDLRDPLVRPLNLSEEEVNQLLSFLNALTGENVDVLVSDAFTVPVGNTETPWN